MAFDERLLKVGIEIGSELVWFEGLAIKANILKTTGKAANDSTVTVSNLTKAHRDHILTETSPWNKLGVRKRVYVECGRRSYGYSRIFSGDIINATVSQPPDISITLTARTNNWNKMQVISKGYSDYVSAKGVADDIAKSMGLSLIWEAQDKQIASYAFTGAKSQQLDHLSAVGNVNAYIDDDKLIVKDIGNPLQSTGSSTVLSQESGMVGIPEATEQGIRVKMMFEPFTKCGAAITITSLLNPSLDGTYIIYKLTYDLANREEPFYMTLEAYKQGRYKK